MAEGFLQKSHNLLRYFIKTPRLLLKGAARALLFGIQDFNQTKQIGQHRRQAARRVSVYRLTKSARPYPLTFPLLQAGRGARVIRRRLYRQWRRTCRGNIGQLCLGKMIVIKGKPRKAAKQQRQGNTNARLFKHLVLTQGLRKGPQRQKVRQPLATPQLGYGHCLKVGTQNVQGMAEILKHQQILDIMNEKSLQLMFLTETRSTSYYTYNSLGYLWILNGDNKDRFAGITAVVAPHIRPFIKDVVQHTSRILQITISMQSGDAHFIGIYAPHDKHDYSSIKEPFWQTLTDIVSAIPYPEPFYIIGDFNVRLQGRKKGEEGYIGPHVFGKGHLAAKTGPERNRTLYTNLLQSIAGCDCQTFKTPQFNQTGHIQGQDTSPYVMDSILGRSCPIATNLGYSTWATTHRTGVFVCSTEHTLFPHQ